MFALPTVTKSILAAACLGTLTLGSAQAVVVFEFDFGDFSNNIAAPTLLGANTTQIKGDLSPEKLETQVPAPPFCFSPIAGVEICQPRFITVPGSPADLADYFRVGNLIAGSLVSVAYSSVGSDGALFASNGLDRLAIPSASPAISFEIGSMQYLSFEMTGVGATSYTIDLTITPPQPTGQVPLAPTAALVAVGALAMGLRRRKQVSQS